jgi:protein SCO1/2
MNKFYGLRLVTVLLPWLLCALGQFAAAFAATLPAYDRVLQLPEGRPIKTVELTNHQGRPFALDQLHGQVVFVFFGFTNCANVCPITMQKFSQLEEAGGADLKGVAYVLVSVDSERDTPDVLKSYLSAFSPRFIGLTGDPSSVKALARNFSAAFFKGSPVDEGGNYLVSHSQQVFVVDPAGLLRAEFHNASIDAMKSTALALLNESKGESKPDSR